MPPRHPNWPPSLDVLREEEHACSHTSPPHRVRHVGNLLTVPSVHGTMVPVYSDREQGRSESQHGSQACAPPDRGLTAAGGGSAVGGDQPGPGTGGAARDTRGLTGLTAS